MIVTILVSSANTANFVLNSRHNLDFFMNANNNYILHVPKNILLSVKYMQNQLCYRVDSFKQLTNSL
jgi:hypothetical protein